MNKDIVSIIIPAYNTEKYLDKCINSVIEQTYQHIEIIIIDDGSTDATAEILAKYVAQDSRIIVITQENNGQGSARRAGLAVATGKAIMFLDSDDYYSHNTVEVVFNALEQNSGDILIFNGKAFWDDDFSISLKSEKYFQLGSKNEGTIGTGIDFLRLTKGRIYQPCLKIYRRDFLNRYNIKFPEGGYGEDSIFLYNTFILAKKVSYIDFIGYHRRYHKDSTMTATGTKNIETRISHFPVLLSLIDKVESTEDKKLIMKQYADYAGILWIMMFNRKSSAERRLLNRKFNEYQLNKVLADSKKSFTIMPIYLVSSLCQCMDFIKIAAAKTAKILLKGKTRFSI